MSREKLAQYRGRRNFRRTPEPSARGRRRREAPRFVIQPVEKDLAAGHAAVWLEGEKLHGGYALTRVGKGKRERWLLVKMDDKGADRRRNPVSSQPQSVLSGKSIKEIAKQR